MIIYIDHSNSPSDGDCQIISVSVAKNRARVLLLSPFDVVFRFVCPSDHCSGSVPSELFSSFVVVKHAALLRRCISEVARRRRFIDEVSRTFSFPDFSVFGKPATQKSCIFFATDTHRSLYPYVCSPSFPQGSQSS